MADWFIGQKIVCIKDDAFPGLKLSLFVKKYLKVGKIYTIEKIIDYCYANSEISLAFILVGIDLSCKGNNIKISGGKDFYAFCERRFKPLEYQTLEELKSLLNDIPYDIKDDELMEMKKDKLITKKKKKEVEKV